MTGYLITCVISGAAVSFFVFVPLIRKKIGRVSKKMRNFDNRGLHGCRGYWKEESSRLAPIRCDAPIHTPTRRAAVRSLRAAACTPFSGQPRLARECEPYL